MLPSPLRRMAYAFSRDGAMPLSSVWCRVNMQDVPVNAVWLSVVSFCMALSSLGSMVPFQAVTSIATIELYIAYALPFIFRATLGSRSFIRGPFNLGVYGVLVGWMAVLWVATITLLFSVPVAYPITRDTLSYTPIAVGGVSSLLLLHGSPVEGCSFIQETHETQGRGDIKYSRMELELEKELESEEAMVYKQHALPLARKRRSMEAVENVKVTEHLFSPTSRLSAYASPFFSAAPLIPHPWTSQTRTYLAYSPIHRPLHHPESEFENPFLHLDQNRGPSTQRNEDGTGTDIGTGTGAKLERVLERIQHNSWKLSQPEGMNSSKVSEVYNTGIRMDLKLEQELEPKEVKVFKRHMLPLAKIRRLMKAVENVEMVSADSIVLFSKACEWFITELTAQSWTFVEESRGKTLKTSHITSAVCHNERLHFLGDVISKQVMKGGTETGPGTGVGAKLEQELEMIETPSWKQSQLEGMNSEVRNKGIRMDLDPEGEDGESEANRRWWCNFMEETTRFLKEE